MRAQIVLLDGDRILLARHRREDHEYWVLPGGAIDAGETAEEAAIREMREETGLEVAVDRLLFIDQPREDDDVVIRQPRYTFLGHVVGGELRHVEDRAGGSPTKGYLDGTAWMPFACPAYDAATNDTLRRVRSALKGH